MEYLIQNTFNKMSYLERLTPETERLKELQAILRSNDIAKEKLLFEEGQTNLAAIEDLRVYLELSARQSRQVVLHDMIEKRYALRPYGWPDEEVLLIVARMLVQGEINLMMDGAPVPLDKAYESLTAQAKRRKVVLVKRQTAAPEAIRNARNLGKELFAEMGPDGGDALFVCLQGKLKDWQASLSAYKPMADTGNYPGGEAIDEGLTLINRLLADKESLKFIERFNLLRKDLLDFSERHHELEHFYAHQRTIWENLRKANARFRPNHLELERDAEASPALARIQTILTAASPYGSIKDVEGLIRIVDRVNSTLLTNRRKEAVQRIDGHHSRLAQDIAAMSGGASLRDACLKPLESLRQRVEKEESVAHITQAETEAMLEFDAGIARIEEFSSKQAETSILPVVKKQRVVKAADLMKATYLETPDEVNAFLKVLRIELERALANNERVQIR
jgi:hypothetical protein